MTMSYSEVYTAATDLHPGTCVAFDVAFGPLAQSRDLSYDIDHALAVRTMTDQGMTAAEIASVPQIVYLSHDTHQTGHMNLGSQAAMRLDSYQGTTEISAKALAHEAHHYVAARQDSERDIVQQPNLVRRKTVATIAGTAIGTVFGKMYSEINIEAGVVVGLVIGDVGISQSLLIEYRTRRDERQAVKAEKLAPDENLLMITSSAEYTSPASNPADEFTSTAKILSGNLRSLGRSMFVPNFID